MAVVYSKVLLFDPPLIYTAPDICVFGAVIWYIWIPLSDLQYLTFQGELVLHFVSGEFAGEHPGLFG